MAQRTRYRTLGLGNLLRRATVAGAPFVLAATAVCACFSPLDTLSRPPLIKAGPAMTQPAQAVDKPFEDVESASRPDQRVLKLSAPVNGF